MDAEYMDYESEGYTLYEFLEEKAAQHSDLTAISFYGNNVTYPKMLLEIDKTARALKAYGVKKDDVVASSLPGTPEGIYIIYAINKIGARYCAFDCRSKWEEIEETLRVFTPKLCIVPDFQLKEFRNEYNHIVVHLNPIRSLGGVIKIPSFLADIFTGRSGLCITHKNFISYDSFIKASELCENVAVKKSSEDIFGYFYTSGTTYGRKSIILSNENVNAAIIFQKEALGCIEAGESILNIMPLFTCYSVTLAVHLPLTAGATVKLIPLIEPKRLKKELVREKPNYIISVPAHWEYFVKDTFENCDLSFIKVAVVGGDVIDKTIEESINKIFKKCGSKAQLTKGYGLSETTSSATVCVNSHQKGSVGRPLRNTLVQIWDDSTESFLPPGKKGEICIFGPTVCRGYFDDRAMTEKLLIRHNDGRVWLHSGDIGYMDEAGYLYFCERKKRMYVRYDGSKISPYSIEQVIVRCPIVQRCMVSAIRDTDHSHGMCARALIVLKDGVNEHKAKEQLNRFYLKYLDQHMVPRETVFVKKLPYTKNGKLDYFIEKTAVLGNTAIPY